MMVDPLEIFVHERPIVSTVALSVSGLFGFCINSFILYKVMWHKVFHGSFGWIWISRGVAYASSSCVTMVFMGFGSQLFPNILGVTGPLMILMGWISCLFSNFLIALNRCLLITRPFTFKTTFTKPRTLLMISVTWGFSFLAVIGAVYFPCKHEEEVGSLFSLQPSLNCDYTLTVFTYGPMWIAIFLTFVIDFYSILSLHRMNKVRDQLSSHQLSPQFTKKVLKLCYMLAVQCIVNPLIMLVVTIGDDTDNPLLNFLSTVFLLSLEDSFDGIIVIAFNDELRSFRNSRGKLGRMDTASKEPA
ncbi:hypothetical protein L596_012561 [Steinernema carpocapsae]|uniref:G-protein coupled receptors family 1 profile domain-containing protein n=1 Tax=Steinernema carpocapsae TaxID=34508 RepID=A0A4U5NXG9_STECR|nr:hypothetical protein L596_012561 [Steinernema carpocapsae]